MEFNEDDLVTQEFKSAVMWYVQKIYTYLMWSCLKLYSMIPC